MSRPRIELAGPVTTVELAEPQKLNPLGLEVLEVFEEVVLKLRTDPDVRVLRAQGPGPFLLGRRRPTAMAATPRAVATAAVETGPLAAPAR